MMKIAIDLNDVMRDYTNNFVKKFKKAYPHIPDVDEIEITSLDFANVFPFENENEYKKFVYEDYSLELFGHCEAVHKDLPSKFNDWMARTIANIETDEPIEIMFVSTMEMALTIQSSFFFLSKIGSRVREIYFPKDSFTIWDKCDVLITANPKLLNNKPDNKISIKIKSLYNEDSEGDYEYSSLMDFISTINNVKKILNNDNI